MYGRLRSRGFIDRLWFLSLLFDFIQVYLDVVLFEVTLFEVFFYHLLSSAIPLLISSQIVFRLAFLLLTRRCSSNNAFIFNLFLPMYSIHTAVSGTLLQLPILCPQLPQPRHWKGSYRLYAPLLIFFSKLGSFLCTN